MPHEGRRWAFLGEGWPCRAEAEGELSLNRWSQELYPSLGHGCLLEWLFPGSAVRLLLEASPDLPGRVYLAQYKCRVLMTALSRK